MEQKYYWIVRIIAVFGILIISGCVKQTETPDSQLTSCDELAKKLDSTIIDTNNPPGRYIISEFEGIVGGTLMDIKYNGLDRGYNSYLLTFQGISSEGELYLITLSNETLPYKTGQFYKFDLADINKYSAALSGSFIDNNLDKFVPITC
jgi:hypothetical protein